MPVRSDLSAAPADNVPGLVAQEPFQPMAVQAFRLPDAGLSRQIAFPREKRRPHPPRRLMDGLTDRQHPVHHLTKA